MTHDADYWRREADRLADEVRALVAENTELRAAVRDYVPRQRPPRTFSAEAEAIDDARERGQCIVLREERHTRLGPNAWLALYHSVPLEAAYESGQLRERWRSMSRVELDQAGEIARVP